MKTWLLVAILCGVVAAAGFLVDLLGEGSGLGSGWLAAGRVALYMGLASCSAALWVHRRYPAWLADRSRPGGRPVLNEESRSQPVWLLVASMIVLYPALGSLLLGLGIPVLILSDRATDVLVDPAKLVVGLLSVAATAAYILAVATKRQHANETGLRDILGVACAFAALALAGTLFLPLVSTGSGSMARGPLAWVCAAAVCATAFQAFVFSTRFRPTDKWGRAEPQRWSYRRRKHA